MNPFLLVCGLAIIGIVLGLETHSIDLTLAGTVAMGLVGLIALWVRSWQRRGERIDAANQKMEALAVRATSLNAQLGMCPMSSPRYHDVKSQWLNARLDAAKFSVFFWETYGREYDSWNYQQCLKAAFLRLDEAERAMRTTPPLAKCPPLSRKARHPHAKQPAR